jgi:hypothetical protein
MTIMTAAMMVEIATRHMVASPDWVNRERQS